MKLLHIDSSALSAASASRQLSAAAVQVLSDANADVQVTYRHLAHTPPAHPSAGLLPTLKSGLANSPNVGPKSPRS